MYLIEENQFKMYWKCLCVWVFFLGLGSCEGDFGQQQDWLKVPIQACITSNEKILDGLDEINAYCECLIPEVYTLVKDDREKVAMMKKGNLDFIKLSNDPEFLAKAEKCRPENVDLRNKAPVSDYLMPHMARGIKIGLRDDLIAKGMADQLDIDAYCDCMVEGIRTTFTIDEFSNKKVHETEKYLTLDKECKSKHERK